MPRMKVHFFDGWCPVLDDALASIPPDPDWPHDLYRQLIDLYSSEPLRVGLWTEGGLPVAVLAFRVANRIRWEPITQWLIPGYIGATQPNRISDVVRTVPLRAKFAWWRMQESPPIDGHIRKVAREATYGAAYPFDFESYWRQTGILNKVRRARKRCERLELLVNAPGSHDWIIRHAEEHWSLPGGTQLASRLMLAEYLLRRGRYFSYTLNDGDRLIAGSTNFVHRDDLVGQVMFRDRDPIYEKDGVGNFLMDVLFRKAHEMSKGVDVGGTYSYKSRWAPERGEKANLEAAPLLLFIGDTLAGGLRNLRNAIGRKRASCVPSMVPGASLDHAD